MSAAALGAELRLGLNLLLPYPDADGNVVLTQVMRKVGTLHACVPARMCAWHPARARARAGAHACVCARARTGLLQYFTTLLLYCFTTLLLYYFTTLQMFASGASVEGLQRAGYYLLHRALQRRAAQVTRAPRGTAHMHTCTHAHMHMHTCT